MSLPVILRNLSLSLNMVSMINWKLLQDTFVFRSARVSQRNDEAICRICQDLENAGASKLCMGVANLFLGGCGGTKLMMIYS